MARNMVFQQAAEYICVHLDQEMMYVKQHLELVTRKVTHRVSLIHLLAGKTRGASTKTLRIFTQVLLFPAAEYCAPVWSRSPHVKKCDVAINSSLRTISGRLKPTHEVQFIVLVGITPVGLRRKAVIIALVRKVVKYDWHILHDTTTQIV